MAATSTLVLERREQRDETPVLGGILEMTPPINEDYWSYRVRLTESQAIVAFPKFGTTGIGYVSEEDWNLNFPWTFDADVIASHIARNKGDAAILDSDVLAAIRLIQEAILEDDPTAAEHLAHVRERRAGHLMPELSTIGQTMVTEADVENPYTYHGILSTGTMRVAALRAFRDRDDTTGMQLWHTPAEGGARKITADEVDWRGMRQ